MKLGLVKKEPVATGMVRSMFGCPDLSPDEYQDMCDRVEIQYVDRSVGILAAVEYLGSRGIKMTREMLKIPKRDAMWTTGAWHVEY